MGKVLDWSKYPNFKKTEFDCKCGCGYNVATDELLSKLQAARTLSGAPFVITSGCRCIAHNRAVSGVDSSSHVLGYAADIAVDTDALRFALVDALLHAGFSRLGIAKGYVHADVDSTKYKNVMWTYYK